jgi:hypothetical protein
LQEPQIICDYIITVAFRGGYSAQEMGMQRLRIKPRLYATQENMNTIQTLD